MNASLYRLVCSSYSSTCVAAVIAAWLRLQAREVADAAVGLLQQHNRRTLDAIGARIYFYYSWAYECTGALADVRRWEQQQQLVLNPCTPAQQQ
jgi:hypothetical protein